MPKKRTTGLAQIPKAAEVPPMTATANPTATQALRRARCGRAAPTFCPTMVRTAPWMPKLGIRAMVDTRSATPQAAKTNEPKGESMRSIMRFPPRSKTFWAEIGQASDTRSRKISQRGAEMAQAHRQARAPRQEEVRNRPRAHQPRQRDREAGARQLQPRDRPDSQNENRNEDRGGGGSDGHARERVGGLARPADEMRQHEVPVDEGEKREARIEITRPEPDEAGIGRHEAHDVRGEPEAQDGDQSRDRQGQNDGLARHEGGPFAIPPSDLLGHEGLARDPDSESHHPGEHKEHVGDGERREVIRSELAHPIHFNDGLDVVGELLAERGDGEPGDAPDDGAPSCNRSGGGRAAPAPSPGLLPLRGRVRRPRAEECP